MGDVAHVIDSVEDDKQFSKIYGGEFGKEGTKGVSLAVMRQPGSNTIEVTDNIKRLLPVFQTQIPPTVHLGIRGDRSKNIREAFQDVQFTMAATLILVVLVIFLFLRNFSATMIPAMALPFSIVGTFAVMKLLNFSLNNISMMALILSIGFVVDDAIVMLENIVRHIEMGETPMQAALHGSREIGFTIVSMTLSLAAVFIPILFMAGILGRLFREFAVTICAAILISGLVSISLTPMLCSRFLRAGKETAHGLFYRTMEGLFDFTLHIYRVTLHWVLRHRPVMLGLFVAVLGVTGYFYVIVQKGFIPDTDNDNYSVTVEAAQGTSYYQMVKYQELVSSIVVQDPDVESFYSMTGGGNFGSAGATGRVMVNLLPRRQRKATVAEIVQRTRPKLSGIPGLRVSISIPAAIRVGGRMSKSAYDYTLYGPDTAQLYEEAPKLERLIARLPGLQEVTSDLQIKTPRVNIVLDRDRAAALNLNWNTVSSTLYDAFGPQFSSTIYSPTNQYRVLLEMLPRYQEHTDGLDLVYMKSDDGNMVPLRAVAKLVSDAGPQSIPHSGQLPSVTISFALKPGMSLGQATIEIEEAAKTSAGHHHRRIPGHRQGFPGFHAEHGHPADRRHRRGLHRARRALRKLRAPADHPLRTAVGRLRRPAHPDPLQGGSQHLFFRRPDHADRHRQEERHHADRFRPRSRAQGRHDAHRSYLPGLRDPFSSHHDDYDGGPARRLAHRARLGRRRRSP